MVERRRISGGRFSPPKNLIGPEKSKDLTSQTLFFGRDKRPPEISLRTQASGCYAPIMLNPGGGSGLRYYGNLIVKSVSRIAILNIRYVSRIGTLIVRDQSLKDMDHLHLAAGGSYA